MKQLINTKDWGHSEYKAYLDIDGDYTSFQGNVTGVVAVCIDENERVVLMSDEPLGGHIEVGESIEEALKRECLEEWGIELESWKYFGYYEISLKEVADKEYKERYPKVGYILFFLAKGKKIMEPYGTDVKNPQSLDIYTVLHSDSFSHEMLQEGLKLYPKYLVEFSTPCFSRCS